MTHHEAQVIADSYKEEARDIRATFTTTDYRTRAGQMEDHSAVWQRVADALKEAPHVP